MSYGPQSQPPVPFVEAQRATESDQSLVWIGVRFGFGFAIGSIIAIPFLMAAVIAVLTGAGIMFGT